MSRTYRKKRHSKWTDVGGEDVRDGSRQYPAGSCEHHGGCPYCESNRLHKHKRREPIQFKDNN